MLILLDRLPRASTNARRLTDSVRTSAAFDESSLLTDLKHHLQDFAVAIVAVVGGNKTPNAQSSGNDEVPIKPSPRNLKRLYGADYTLALHSADTIMKSTASEKTVDQLHLAQEWYKRNLSQCRGRVERLFEEARAIILWMRPVPTHGYRFLEETQRCSLIRSSSTSGPIIDSEAWT